MKDISRELVASLLPMERALEITDVSSVAVIDYLKGVREANRLVTQRVKSAESVLQSDFIADVHRTIANHVGSEQPGVFKDAGRPKSWSWSKLVAEMFEDGGEDVATITRSLRSGSQVYILIALAMDNHLADFGLTVGWLIMNGYIMSGGGAPIVAPEDQADGWARGIRNAVSDAEGLRGRIINLTAEFARS